MSLNAGFLFILAGCPEKSILLVITPPCYSRSEEGKQCLLSRGREGNWKEKAAEEEMGLQPLGVQVVGC